MRLLRRFFRKLLVAAQYQLWQQTLWLGNPAAALSNAPPLRYHEIMPIPKARAGNCP